MLALDIGHALGVPLNRACLIPAGVPFIGKETNVPATLHTYAPGVRFDAYKGKMYKYLNIGQMNTEKEFTGLVREVIYHMSWHKDLPAMVALDTFTGNCDRFPVNYFYNEITDTFCGIDMAAAIRYDLCSPSIKNIQNLLDDESVIFTHAELQGLKRYAEALEWLVAHNNPEELCNRLENYAKMAGFFEDSFFDKDIQLDCINYFVECKLTISESYGSAIKLIKLLNELLGSAQILL